MERRGSERLLINLSVTCRMPASPRAAVVHDISYGGCKLEVAGKPIELGATALLELPGTSPVDGRIVWTHGKFGGMRFEQELGHAAAVSLGLEQAEAEAIEPEEAGDRKAPDGALHHWVRRSGTRSF